MAEESASQQKVLELEARLRRIEDQLAIYQVIGGYGYAADGMNSPAVGGLYAENGVYQVNDRGTHNGRAAVQAIVESRAFAEAVAQGLAHMSTTPYVVVDGDRAVATCYTMLGRYDPEIGFFLARISASRAELERTAEGGWHITHRTLQGLDGDERGPQLLARFQEITRSGVAPGADGAP